MRDPYEVLGVPRVGRARRPSRAPIRKLAKKLHPDANKNDPKAAQRFAELNAAYEILGDDDKRKAFDRGEIDAEGKPRFQGFEGFRGQPGGGLPRRRISRRCFTWGRKASSAAARGGGGGFGGFEDILKGMFGGRGGRQAAAPASATHVDMEDFAAPPAGRDVAVPRHHHARRSRQGRHAPRPPADRQGGGGEDSGRARRRPADPAEGAGPARPRQRSATR